MSKYWRKSSLFLINERASAVVLGMVLVGTLNTYSNNLKYTTSSSSANLTSCQNEESNQSFQRHSQNQQQQPRQEIHYPKATSTQKFMHKVFNKPLPTPRLLTTDDPIFEYKELRKGLKQRQADEKKLERIQKDIKVCIQANDTPCVETKMKHVYEILYGKNISMQTREDFLIRYGCTPYNQHILDRILAFDRPIMDIGAGNGQWARALSDRAKKLTQREDIFDFVVAYDDYTSVPLNTEIYHKLTKPAHDFFFDVKKMDGVDAVRLVKNRGRILLMVYPSPGPFAVNVLKAYSKHAENDFFVFVGEGIGGANGNHELFDYLRQIDDNGNAWVILEIISVPSMKEAGTKGFEKVFIFQKVKAK
jgi:hypothetical protein